MKKITVAVLFGGESSEHEVSKMSAFNVIDNLDDKKYNIVPIYITNDGRWFLYDGAIDAIRYARLGSLDTRAFLCPDTERPFLRMVNDSVKDIAVDIVFPVLHGQNGEDGRIQGLCELCKLPYVGCGVMSSAICLDKAITNLIADSIGLNQPKYLVFKRGHSFANVYKAVKKKLNFPVFVKPANTGSSIGISKANDQAELEKAVNDAFKYDKKIVIEKAVNGREFEVSVIGNTELSVSGVGEIIVDNERFEFYDYNAKYLDDSSKTLVNVILADEIKKEIQKAATDIYSAVDGLGMARVDFFLEHETNKLFFNEINTIPGFTSISMYAKLWEASDFKSGDMMDKLIELGLARYEL